MKTKTARLILWGKKSAHGDVWLKLNDNGHIFAARDRARKDGWEVIALRKGESPCEK